VLSGLLLTLCLFPICRDAVRLRLKSSWALALLDALGVELDADLTYAVPRFFIGRQPHFVDRYLCHQRRFCLLPLSQKKRFVIGLF
jgi:hypothetical protein